MAKCRKCGAEICFVRKQKDKTMPEEKDKAIPINPGGVYYVPDRYGDATLITEKGERVLGVVVDGFEDVLGDIPIYVGRVPHWVTCTGTELEHKKARVSSEREELRRIAAENRKKREAERQTQKKATVSPGQRTFF